MGWFSTETSLNVDEFFKQNIAVDCLGEKIIAVSGKTVLWQNTKENIFYVLYYQMSKEDGQVSYKLHGASETLFNISLPLIREAIRLNKEAGNTLALKAADELNEALLKQLKYKADKKQANASLQDTISELKALRDKKLGDVVITLTDNTQIIFVCSYQDYKWSKTKSKFIVAYRADDLDKKYYKWNVEDIKSYAV